MLNNKHQKINELYNQYQHEKADKQLKERNIVDFLDEVEKLIKKVRQEEGPRHK